MSTPKKTLAVLGATGAQGGGLVRAILADPAGGFAARAITRNAASPAALELERLGAEVVAADVDDEKSLERAFAGAHGVYAVTFFWAHMQPEREIDEARKIAAAAKAAQVKHLVWSTLEDTRRWVPLADDRMPTLMGRYKVPHFDAKGEADRAFTEAGVPTTFLLTSFYWENLIHFGMGPKPGPDGTLVWAMPLGSGPFPGIAVEDIGRCAHGVFKRGTSLAGQYVGVAGDQLTGEQMAAALSTALGRTVHYHALSPAQYRGFGFPGAEDLGNMFQFNTEFADAFCGARNVTASRALNPLLLSFAQWLEANKASIPTT